MGTKLWGFEGFVGKEQYFKDDALFDREQVESVKDTCEIFTEPGVR